MFRKILWLTSVISYLALYSCTEDQSFTLGENLVDIKSNVIVVDTITINTYTVKADSVKTSGYKKALVGRYTDGNLGTINASTYFQLALPSSLAINENSRFDSISIILKPTGYCYGDSTKPFTIQVHKLLEDLENDDVDSRFNTSKVSYSEAILGSKTTIVRPNSGRELSIKLDSDFGQELFNIILNEGTQIESQANFIKYLKGFALTPDELSESSVLQFNAKDSLIKMRLYYHDGREAEYFEFNLTNTSLQFNRITSEFLNSPLAVLNKLEDFVPSTLTENSSYCQAGTGIMSKLEFPYLKNLFETTSTYKILSAELIIKPVKMSYDMVPLPGSLNLNITNSLNETGSLLVDSKSTAIVPTLIKDNMYNQTAYYFDITNYITYIFKNLKDEAPGLLLSLPADSYGNSLERLVLGNYNDESNAIQIKITYWKY